MYYNKFSIVLKNAEYIFRTNSYIFTSEGLVKAKGGFVEGRKIIQEGVYYFPKGSILYIREIKGD